MESSPYISMSGGALARAKGEFELANIGTVQTVSDLPTILLAILIVDVVVIFMTRYMGIGGKSLNKWYDHFGFLAVVADCFIIFIGFLLARYVYTAFFEKRFGWNPVYFVLLLVAIQLIHDVLFYVGVIRPIPVGHNEMMDVFKEYATENGGAILGADAIMMIVSALLAMTFKSAVPAHGQSLLAALTVYAMSYVLYTEPWKAKKLTAPTAATKAVAK